MPSGIRTRREINNDDDSWMMTFGDVIALLLAFFVLILSTSSPDIGKFERFQQAMASLAEGKAVPTPFTDIRDGLQEIIEENDLQQSVHVELKPDGVVMEFSDLSLFKPGKADLNANSIDVLTKASEVIRKNQKEHYLIEIEGHTDDLPIHNNEFESNWELSSARSTGVVRHFIGLGVDPNKLKGAAYADTRPKVELGTDGVTDTEARAQNRRIVIFVHR